MIIEMLMFSRNLAKVEGKGRDGRPLAETETRMVTRRGEDKEDKVEEEAANTGSSFFSRSTARASLKKSRPHSWHSTLQVDIDHVALLSSESQIYWMFQRNRHHHHDLNAFSEDCNELGVGAAGERRKGRRGRPPPCTVSRDLNNGGHYDHDHGECTSMVVMMIMMINLLLIRAGLRI